MRRLALAGLLSLGLPGMASAQALRCAVPGAIPTPRPDLPSAGQPVRRLPIGSYTLALTGVLNFAGRAVQAPPPSFSAARASGSVSRCTVCGPTEWGANGRNIARRRRCSTGVRWRRTCARRRRSSCLQHEWAKHGTCMNTTPPAYFAKARALYDPLNYPNMDALSRRALTAGQLAQAFARANPGLSANMLRITTKRGGWLDEIWLCLDTRLRYRACPAHQGGVAASSRLRIWRGRR